MIADCVSYPKSGRSWLRYMLRVAGHGEAVRFHHDGFEFNDGRKPAHNFELSARLRRYAADDRVIYLERDPRDVMVSLYHQVTGRFADFFDYRGSISEFLRDDYFGASTLAEFRRMWRTVLMERSYLHLTYEEMHADTVRALRRVLSYLELDASDADIAASVEQGRFENMQSVEMSGQFDEPWLRTRNGFPKVRSGKVGSYHLLSQEDVEYLNRIFFVV